MLFTQLCGYPLQKLFRSQTLVLAAPVYDGQYCEGATHCGVFVVQRAAPYKQLADLRSRRFVFGGPYSNSGMNLPRRAIAEIAGGSPFFESATLTDSQAENLELVARGEADATCVDSMTYGCREASASSGSFDTCSRYHTPQPVDPVRDLEGDGANHRRTPSARAERVRQPHLNGQMPGRD